MSLTVPKAGIVAGRAAEVRIETPRTGAALNQLGQVMLEKGLKLQQERQDRQTRTAQLDIARDLGQARQQVEQTADPDALGPSWDQAVADVRARYITDQTDPKVREGLELTIRELGDRHALALGNRAIGLRQSQQEADWIDARQRITTDAATADPETVEAYLELGDAQISARLARGVVSPEQAALDRQQLRADIASARSTRAIDTDPEAFLKAADAGQYNALGAEALASRRAMAQAEVDRRAAAAAKAAEVAAKERQEAIGRRLTEMTGLMSQGRVVADEAFLKDPEVQAHPGYAEAAAAQQLRGEMPAIRQMTPAQLDAAIAAEEKKPLTYRYQSERLKVLRQWRDSAAKDWTTNPVDTARTAGMPVADLPDFDPSDPDAFTAAVQSRLALNGAVRSGGYTRTAAIFTPDEAGRLKTVLDPKADPAPKVALARAFLRAGGGQIDQLAGAVGADTVFRRAARTIAQTGSDALATEILRGQQRQKLGTVNMPTAGNMRSIFDQVTGGAFDGSPAQKAELIDAAAALYADAAPDVLDGADSALSFLDDDEAVERFSTAIQRVTGATPDTEGRLTIGGVQEIRGTRVSLPPAVSAEEVETAFDRVQRHVDGIQWGVDHNGVDPTQVPTPDRLAAVWTKASIDGTEPNLGRSPGPLFRQLRLQRVGESDVYEFVYRKDGRTWAIPTKGDPNGRAWRFRLPELIREAAR